MRITTGAMSPRNARKVDGTVTDHLVSNEQVSDQYGHSTYYGILSLAAPLANKALKKGRRRTARARAKATSYQSRLNIRDRLCRQRDELERTITQSNLGPIGYLVYAIAFVVALVADLFIGGLIFSFIGSSPVQAPIKAGGLSVLLILSGKAAGFTFAKRLAMDKDRRRETGVLGWAPVLFAGVVLGVAVAFAAAVTATIRARGVELPMDTAAIMLLVSFPVLAGVMLGWYKPDALRQFIFLYVWIAPNITINRSLAARVSKSGFKLAGRSEEYHDNAQSVAESISFRATSSGIYYSPVFYDETGEVRVRTLEMIGIGSSKAELDEIKRVLATPWEPKQPTGCASEVDTGAKGSFAGIYRPSQAHQNGARL